MIRIIAGQFKRRRLATLDGEEVTRPTSDRVRENLFNIISGWVEDARVLDLFSGSGALGIEALSRGAQSCHFVEKDRRALEVLRSNLESLELAAPQAQLLGADVAQVLADPKRLIGEGKQFDLVFADPPYKSDWYELALDQLFASGLLSKNCRICFEMNRYTEVKDDALPHFEKVLQRDYGKTRIQIFEIL